MENQSTEIAKPLVSEKIAVQEINNWLDARKVRQRSRIESQIQINTLVDEVMEGTLTVGPDLYIKHKLLEPIVSDKGDIILSEIVYQPRVKVESIITSTKITDPKAYVLGYAAAITNTSASMLAKLETTDYRILSAITGFFM